MYRVIKDGVTLGMTESPTYITKAGNGCFILCPEAEARGIAFEGTPYHVLGKEPLEGAEDVLLESVDGGAGIMAATQTGDKNTSNIDYLSMMTGVDLPTEDEEV